MLQSTVTLIILALCLGCAAWLVFIWAARTGEFEDVEEPKYRMLEDDDLPASQNGFTQNRGDTGEKRSLRAEDQAKQSPQTQKP